jgi:putative SOS response-associated peptidase YedK
VTAEDLALIRSVHDEEISILRSIDWTDWQKAKAQLTQASALHDAKFDYIESLKVI